MIKKPNSSGTIRQLLVYAKPYRGLFYLSLVFALLGVAAAITAPYMVGAAIDYMVAPGAVDFAGVFKIAAILAVLYLVSAAFSWMSSILATIMAQSTIKVIRVAFIETLHKMPLSYIDRKGRGDLISRVINDLETVSQGLLQGVIQLVTGLATIGFTIVMMLYLNAYIGLAVIGLTPLSIFIAVFIAKMAQKLFKRQQATLGALNSAAEEYIGGMKTIKSNTSETVYARKFKGFNEDYREAYKRAHFNSALVHPSTRLVNYFVYITAGVLGIALKASIGSIGSFLMYANQYTKPFNEISSIVTELQSALAAANRVMEVLNAPSAETDAPNAVEIGKTEGRISFKNVEFGYSPDERLITDFNLEVATGEKIAIVGPTGAGKTTLVNLLMRFYELDGGQIAVDDINITDIARRSLRKSFGMVLQNTWLYSATVRDNIAYGKPDATDDEIVRVAKMCHCHEFITAMEKGYDTIVSDAGGNLSAGQRQLLCIARVMLTAPSMLILDEATSNIDTRTEMQISEAFDILMGGKTSFIIAHRLSTIRSADKILVLNDGNIVESGNHSELMEKQGFYYSLYTSQFTAD